MERVRDGTHTLVTAQRWMGKTSLVRELLRRLKEDGAFETVFVDLEDANDAADAIAETGTHSVPVQVFRRRIMTVFANALREVQRIEELSLVDMRVKLRAGVDDRNWRQKGDEVFSALAESDRPVVLAIDELPILVDRMLKNGGDRIEPEGCRAAGAFLSWLRKNGQAHKGRVILILSGSVSLEPILRRAGLSAQANIYSPFDLKPWNEEDRSRLPRCARGDLRHRPSSRRPARHVCSAAMPDTPSRAAVLRMPSGAPAPRRTAHGLPGRRG